MRTRRLLAVAALASVALAAPGIAAAKPQILDAKGDAIGAQAGTDIQSVTFEAVRKGSKVSRLIITMTLDAPANRTPGVLYRVFGNQSKCGTFQLSSAATLALVEQNQVYMTCGESKSVEGGGAYTIINVTPDSKGNTLVWTIGIKELPTEMQSGTMTELQAFVSPAEPVFGIINTADEVPGAAFDVAAGTGSFRY